MKSMTVSIVTAKPAELAEFYSRVFGFKVKTHKESGTVLRTATLMKGLEIVIVADGSGKPPKKGMGQIFHITHSDTPKIIERAKKKKCDVKVAEDGKSAFLFDPSGQPWEISSPA